MQDVRATRLHNAHTGGAMRVSGLVARGMGGMHVCAGGFVPSNSGLEMTPPTDSMRFLSEGVSGFWSTERSSARS